jgi:Toastrack DUF4097
MNRAKPAVMDIMGSVTRLLVIGLICLVCFAFHFSARAGDLERHFSFDCEELQLINLIGEIHVEKTSGNEFIVELEILGDDADGDLIEVDQKSGNRSRLTVQFPTKKERKYTYPGLRGRNAKIDIREPKHRSRNDNNHGFLRAIFGSSRKIHVSKRGSGLELWVDVTVKVPEGGSLIVRHGAGDMFAEHIVGDLVLDSSHGMIGVTDHVGELVADTGSGHVQIDNIKGEINIDTGSGSVEASECICENFKADTGSGSVKVRNIECEYLDIDTGSGRVRATGIQSDGARIDTGSGSVTLILDQMGHGNYKIDTGSGGIELSLPDRPSARITADTGSGSITTSIDGVRIKGRSRDHIQFTLGDGDARIVLDAGSGSIHIE